MIFFSIVILMLSLTSIAKNIIMKDMQAEICTNIEDIRRLAVMVEKL